MIGPISNLQARAGAYAVGLAIAVLLAGCPNPPTEPLPPLDAPPARPLAIGMEYAVPGMGATLADTGLPAAKFLPEMFAWDKMQPREEAPINFSLLDRMIREYQEAGIGQFVIGLVHRSRWASKDPRQFGNGNYAPKPEFEDDYAAWVEAVVERYDFDGQDDMPGLRAPVTHYEIGVEFSTFVPEPVDDYLRVLELGYNAAHAAYAEVTVAHAAFLTTTAFENDPGPGEFEAAFAAMSDRIAHHTLTDIRALLDRSDLFDVLNLHALSSPYMIPRMVAWARYEMAQRGYDKPVIISDTAPNFLIAWGPATFCDRPPEQMGILVSPATEADRCRLASYFSALTDSEAPNHKRNLHWNWGFVARDMIKKIVIAAEQDVRWINGSFVEDLIFQQPLAGAGTSAWAGITEVSIGGNQERTPGAPRPLFYALRQLLEKLAGYDTIIRIPTDNPDVYLYQVEQAAGSLPTFWIAWYEPAELVLPEDTVPRVILDFDLAGTGIQVEQAIDRVGMTSGQLIPYEVNEGVPGIPLTHTPVYIEGN